eukprot:s5072_g4.t1
MAVSFQVLQLMLLLWLRLLVYYLHKLKLLDQLIPEPHCHKGGYSFSRLTGSGDRIEKGWQSNQGEHRISNYAFNDYFRLKLLLTLFPMSHLL